MVVLAALYVDMRCVRCGLYRHDHVGGMNPLGKTLVPDVHREGPMTALSPGDSWTVISAIGFTAAVACLAAAAVYAIATARQDREDRTRPERRRWVSVEESNAENRRAGSVVGLIFTVVAILVVIVLAALGV